MKETLICECFSEQHTLKITHDEECNTFSIDMYIIPRRGLFNRLKIAIAYLFNYNKFWQFENFILSADGETKLMLMLNNKFDKTMQKFNKH